MYRGGRVYDLDLLRWGFEWVMVGLRGGWGWRARMCVYL